MFSAWSKSSPSASGASYSAAADSKRYRRDVPKVSVVNIRPTHMLGRLPREFNACVPHYSVLACRSSLMGIKPIVVPDSVHYASGISAPLGMLLNDKLGDCTCAGVLHAIQIWSSKTTGKMIHVTDQDVLQLYEKWCGYNPRYPNTDQGAVEQNVLAKWVTQGAAIADGNILDKLAMFVEMDCRRTDDICKAIYECGVVYIGAAIPAYADSNPEVWDDAWNSQHNRGHGGQIIGGHCVILVGYDKSARTFDLVSWGAVRKMSFDFFLKYVDEAYALVDPLWFKAVHNNENPLGLTLVDVEQQMLSLKHARWF